MSSVYHTEPATRGKVILHTSFGPIDVELWPKEAPLACRNFIQLSLEGYYDQTILHRVIPKFMVQGGDPTGSGDGGDSIWDKPFKDEIHARIRFNHRGQLAMANENRPNTNRSQFFFTFDECRWLDGKHTIFGTVVGNTIFNLLRMGTVEINPNTDRPVDDIILQTVEVLNNPFDDIVPRELSTKNEESFHNDRHAVVSGVPKKNLNLLSFAQNNNDENQNDDLSESQDFGHFSQQERIPQLEKRRRITPSTLPLPGLAEYNESDDEEEILSTKKTAEDLDDEANDFAVKMAQKIRNKHTSKRSRTITNDDEHDVDPPNKHQKLQEIKLEAQQAIAQLNASRAIASTNLTTADCADEDTNVANALLTPYEVLRRKRTNKDIRNREEDTLSRLAAFQNTLKSFKQGQPATNVSTIRASNAASFNYSTTTTTTTSNGESYHGQILQDDEGQDDEGNAPDWFIGKLKFRRHTDELFRDSTEGGNSTDDYITLDDKKRYSGYT